MAKLGELMPATRAARIMELVCVKPMDREEIVDAMPHDESSQVRFLVNRMFERQGLLQRSEGYYTPSPYGLRMVNKMRAGKTEVVGDTSHSALVQLIDHGPQSVASYAERNGCGRRAANSMLASLKARGLVVSVGEHKYAITAKGRKAVETRDDIDAGHVAIDASEVVRAAIATQPNSIFNLGARL